MQPVGDSVRSHFTSQNTRQKTWEDHFLNPKLCMFQAELFLETKYRSRAELEWPDCFPKTHVATQSLMKNGACFGTARRKNGSHGLHLNLLSHCLSMHVLRGGSRIRGRYEQLGVFTLSDAQSFYELTSKIPPLGSMLNFDADVKTTTARHQCENPYWRCRSLPQRHNFTQRQSCFVTNAGQISLRAPKTIVRCSMHRISTKQTSCQSGILQCESEALGGVHLSAVGRACFNF